MPASDKGLRERARLSVHWSQLKDVSSTHNPPSFTHLPGAFLSLQRPLSFCPVSFSLRRDQAARKCRHRSSTNVFPGDARSCSSVIACSPRSSPTRFIVCIVHPFVSFHTAAPSPQLSRNL